ncbi:pyrimidine deoxynucleoside triphosphate (dYTP) pyrophosphohydrolase YfoO [Klebsiella michiganensis]|nr:pyrimidine deoxynucleoside triphosphate (dYTP) pyrophosphohydrolase YfoO [Klebsiella michiganensis]
MRQRTIVCPLIHMKALSAGAKWPDDRGVFPGQWALSGGGVEPGGALKRRCGEKIREELAKNCS